MKRMVLIAGLALSIVSCAQHDSKSPDTSGVDPQNPNQVSPVTTGDTANGGRGGTNSIGNGGNTGGNNMNNDGTNNNQTVTTGDSSINKNRQQ
jgi:hypothetical protein